MAEAPRPGANTRQGLRLTMFGTDRYDIDFNDFGPRDSLLIREETRGRLTLRQVFDRDAFDIDSIAVLWWLARRRNGEPILRLSTVLDQFPSYGDMTANPDLVVIEELGGDVDAGLEAADDADTPLGSAAG